MDKRWQLIEILPCEGSIVVIGAGTEAVNGTYCPDVMENGWAVWTKVGGTRLEDSIYRAFYDSGSGLEDLGYFIMTSGGSFEDDPLNALYSTYGTPGTPFMTWDIYGSFGPGGDAPGPSSAFTEERIPVIRDVTPTFGGKFTRERDLSNGCIGYRRKLASELTFTGDDYKFFLTYEKSRTRRCYEFTIRRQWKCAGRWRTFWTGTFSTGAGKWDRTGCTFKVKPEVLDKYSCVMKALKKPVNVLSVPSENVIFKPSCLEFGVVITRFNFGASCTWRIISPSGVDTDPTFALANTHNLDALTQVQVYWREVAETDCEAGSPVTPNGAGWTLLNNDCGGTNTATWWRTPTATYAFDNTSLTPCAQEANSVELWAGGTFPIISGGCGNTTLDPVYLCVPGYIQCDSVEAIEYTRARPLEDAINKILETLGCADAETVRSDFFEWDPPGTVAGYVSGDNYVTGNTNQVDGLKVIQRSDAIDPTSSNPARIGDMTLLDVVNLFAKAFRVYWDIEDGAIRFEHIKHWNEVTTSATIAPEIERMEYAHLTQDIPRRERLTFPDSFLDDFIGVDVEYDSPCATGDDDTRSYDVGLFMTDVYNVQLSGASLDKKGFLLLATHVQGTNIYVINDTGAYTSALVPNAPVSTANIQRDYWTWDRLLLDGNMNGADVRFDDIQPTIEQRDVMAKMCCDVFDFDASNRVIGGLSKILGTVGNPRAAVVHREEVDEATGFVKLTLRYGI